MTRDRIEDSRNAQPVDDAMGWDWQCLLSGPAKAEFETALRDWLPRQRWFGGKARAIVAARLEDLIALSPAVCFALVALEYAAGEPETYLLPLGVDPGPTDNPPIARLAEGAHGPFQLYNALADEAFARILLELIATGRQIASQSGSLVAWSSRMFGGFDQGELSQLRSRAMSVEQSNSSIQYGERFVLKLFRRLEAGINTELEISSFLTEIAGFEHTPPMAGAIEHRRPRKPPRALALLQRFVPNERDAWQFTLSHLERLLVSLGLTSTLNIPDNVVLPREPLLQLVGQSVPDAAREIAGEYLTWAKLLGTRTGDLHLALVSGSGYPEFQPEPMDRSVVEAYSREIGGLIEQTFALLRKQVTTFPATAQSLANRVLAGELRLRQRFGGLGKHDIAAQRIRCHGDYHLGQVLFTGDDFVIIDFEGEPTRSLADRRQKRSPLKDIAGMLRSFDYARHSARLSQDRGDAQGGHALDAWLAVWRIWTSAAFLEAYLAQTNSAGLLPTDPSDLQLLLDAHLVEKAVYELNYEMNNRPDWVAIPLAAIDELIQDGQS